MASWGAGGKAFVEVADKFWMMARFLARRWPLSVGTGPACGFDFIVPRSTMRIEYVTTHGTPSGNDNLTGDDILAAVQEVLAGL